MAKLASASNDAKKNENENVATLVISETPKTETKEVENLETPNVSKDVKEIQVEANNLSKPQVAKVSSNVQIDNSIKIESLDLKTLHNLVKNQLTDFILSPYKLIHLLNEQRLVNKTIKSYLDLVGIVDRNIHDFDLCGYSCINSLTKTETIVWCTITSKPKEDEKNLNVVLQFPKKTWYYRPLKKEKAYTISTFLKLLEDNHRVKCMEEKLRVMNAKTENVKFEEDELKKENEELRRRIEELTKVA